MLDIRTSKPSIAIEFALTGNRAMQSAAFDPITREFYVSQAEGTLKPESIRITRNSVRIAGKRKALSTMRLVGAGHGSVISTLRIAGKLGIVTNAWGALVWVPYRAGDVKKGDPTVKRMWSGGYAYIDHEAHTVCISSSTGHRLYELLPDGVRGKQIGKTATGVTGPGPGQGFCTMKYGTEFYLFTMWDYGRLTSKPTVSVGSFTTGALLYRQSARVLSKFYTRQEPEGGFGHQGDFYLGMSTVLNGVKRGVAIRFPLPVPPVVVPPVVKPPVVVVPPVVIKPETALHGNDVSSYQPLWKPAATDGFAFVKATQGTVYVNPFRKTQVSNARKLGIVVGHYHYLNKGNPLEQARHFVKQANPWLGDILVCDWEGDWAKGKHPTVAEAAAFIAEVQRLKPEHRVILYCNRSDWMTTAVKAADGLWIAEYGVAKPSTQTDWLFWQFTDKTIDRNWSRFTNIAALKAWANGKRKAI